MSRGGISSCRSISSGNNNKSSLSSTFIDQKAHIDDNAVEIPVISSPLSCIHFEHVVVQAPPDF